MLFLKEVKELVSDLLTSDSPQQDMGATMWSALLTLVLVVVVGVAAEFEEGNDDSANGFFIAYVCSRPHACHFTPRTTTHCVVVVLRVG